MSITNTSTWTMEKIINISNSSSFPEFAVKMNYDVYGGLLYFIMLIVLWIILYIPAQRTNDQPLNNIMMTGAVITLISFLLRATEIYYRGFWQGMLSDKLMWIFPLVTIFSAWILWMTKDQ